MNKEDDREIENMELSNDGKKAVLKDGLDCHLCAKMKPLEIYEKWGGDIEKRYYDTCKKHRPVMIERLEYALKEVKKLMAN